jgi:hypothetical protein
MSCSTCLWRGKLQCGHKNGAILSNLHLLVSWPKHNQQKYESQIKYTTTWLSATAPCQISAECIPTCICFRFRLASERSYVDAKKYFNLLVDFAVWTSEGMFMRTVSDIKSRHYTPRLWRLIFCHMWHQNGDRGNPWGGSGNRTSWHSSWSASDTISQKDMRSSLRRSEEPIYIQEFIFIIVIIIIIIIWMLC